MDCRTATEWEEALLALLGNEEARRQAGQKGKSFAEKYFGEERILEQWDVLFSSLLARGEQEIADATLTARA